MMVQHTPSWKAAASLLPFHENTICFVGYCDPATPGGELLQTKPGDKFLFEQLNMDLPLRAKIRKFDLSGHANRDELMSFALSQEPRSVVLTHGDPDARDWFSEAFQETLNPPQITIPKSFEPCLV